MFATLRPGELGQQQRQLHILLRRKHRNQVEALEHETNLLCTPLGELRSAHRGDVLPIDDDLSFVRAIEPPDQVQQRGLART